MIAGAVTLVKEARLMATRGKAFSVVAPDLELTPP